MQKSTQNRCIDAENVVSYQEIGNLLPQGDCFFGDFPWVTCSTVGIHGEQSQLVTNENTAKTMGSGTLDVFATPALVALAEKTCWMSVASELDEGCGSVGTKLELEHTAPTPVGMTVTCESELTAVEGRKLVFKVSLHDEKGPVGGGVHERFVVNDAKFAAKAESKKG